jgi:hypothetical protein
LGLLAGWIRFDEEVYYNDPINASSNTRLLIAIVEWKPNRSGGVTKAH